MPEPKSVSPPSLIPDSRRHLSLGAPTPQLHIPVRSKTLGCRVCEFTSSVCEGRIKQGDRNSRSTPRRSKQQSPNVLRDSGPASRRKAEGFSRTWDRP